ncbi:geranylgeranylglyceryl/heptaprenylglyceryl phosphate synthase [Algoriphagus sp. oki45]|uniref:geranylgeranylglyceryl/heptaprenylglyceryl phosphate synthase n=1 Tax=Algoriphagus sp. oki45 TaxID=3067294 RepID=UPI0027E75851|nr:geranylgeranylglyceryl/heptaprenylglyceryl phosphate synthase [Algoriphagus sp. oki45]
MKKVKKLLDNLSKSGKKGVAWLIDPEKGIDNRLKGSHDLCDLDLILVGGSYSTGEGLDELIREVKELVLEVPVCIFPGSHGQVSREAEALLFLSLLSGRNPEYLIGQQVQAARQIHESGLEVIPTAYILVNNGELLSVHSVSQTLPLLNSQVRLVADTALAGKFLGLKCFYLDAGSGSSVAVSQEVIFEVKSLIKDPLIVGGGLDSRQKVKMAFDAGADLVVLGNRVEKDPEFLKEILQLKKAYNYSLEAN